MNSLLNTGRPPVFCPGCSHEIVTRAVDKAFQTLGLRGDQIAIVSDIGCSGLFDTFFNTHAMHGLHGRALTYATGLKMARPDLTVVVTMGDGGLGIGGAHLLSACRRNLDLTLLILNNFNFGMTGGQFSSTTPSDSRVGSGFLNRLESPLDVCEVAAAAGAGYVTRCSTYEKDLPGEIARGIGFGGFAILDIWGVCTGRFTRLNKLTPQGIEKALAELPPARGPVERNVRKEYSRHYRELASELAPVPFPKDVPARFTPIRPEREEVAILGSAGQRILTAGEILCLAGLTAGLRTTQKNDYNITVLRGPSISELILDPKEIGFTGADKPSVVIALSPEGVARRKSLFAALDAGGLVIQVDGVDIPATAATVHKVDFKGQGIRPQDQALASLAVLASLKRVVTPEMLRAALEIRFGGPVLQTVLDLVGKIVPVL